MKEELRVEIGKRVRELRKKLNFKQEEMVKHLKVIGRADYSRIENGEIFPNPVIMYFLKDQFSVSLDWLVTGKGQMTVNESDEPLLDKQKLGNQWDDVKSLLVDMEKIPMLRYAVLHYYLQYKFEHRESIAKFLEMNEKKENDDLKNKDTTSPKE